MARSSGSGCTVAPGFDFADFRMPSRAELLEKLPQHRELVTALTR
jgi:predicted cupin superfamily sugar epimerase